MVHTLEEEPKLKVAGGTELDCDVCELQCD